MAERPFNSGVGGVELKDTILYNKKSRRERIYFPLTLRPVRGDIAESVISEDRGVRKGMYPLLWTHKEA